MKEEADILQLNGEWYFSLDPDLCKDWHQRPAEKPENTIQIPGSWEEQGFGETSDHDPIGTWKKDREYEGTAWYVKEIDIPQGWKKENHRYLVIKGVRWFTELFVDGKSAGTNDSLITPHCFDISSLIHPGRRHHIVIKVDNSMALRLHESHIHSYHTSTYWGGITGGIEIREQPPFSFQTELIRSDFSRHAITFDCSFSMETFHQEGWSLQAEVFQEDGQIAAENRIPLTHSRASIEVYLGQNAVSWSPAQPYLYHVKLTLLKNEIPYTTKQFQTGFREIKTDSECFLLNDIPVFLAGYVDCCVFPNTGYPVWDKSHYRYQFRKAKQFGFNHVRLHGWTPPEPFWEAADEEGMLVQAELPHWSRYYLNRKKKAPAEVQSFLKSELENVLTLLTRHPSFVMFSMGNELIGEDGHEELNELVRYGRELDSTRIYTDNTGFGQLPANDREGDFFIPTLNWHPPYNIDHAAGPETTMDYREVTRLEHKPLIAHEHGQFTMYLNPAEEEKYQGVLKPNWLKTTIETLKAKNLEHRVDEFIEASGVHLVRSLKETMEKARRTPGLSGIQLLDIRDFPGQGHATVGILDVFWDDKKVVSAEEFRQFNDQTVLLMQSGSRTYYNGEHFQAGLEVSHFGSNVETAEVRWRIISEKGKTVCEEKRGELRISGKGLTRLADIKWEIPEGRSFKWQLKAELRIGARTYYNDWDFWSYPRLPLPETQHIWTNIPDLRSILYDARVEDTIGINEHSFQAENNVDAAVTNQLSRDVLQYLIDGGSVWMMAEKNNQHGEIPTRYLPTFWNYVWFPEQTGTTMGIINHPHPAFRNFSLDPFSNWNWFYLVDNTPAISLDLTPQVDPIIEVIDNFNRAKRLAYAFEGRVGKGKLFVTTFNLTDIKLIKKPEFRYLIITILHYLNSREFQPTAFLTVGELLGIFKVRSLIKMRY
ncbi:glycoside hydrolase family 2 protein [Salibacterium aidingense]|uniref:glycoside hydrolase family 2 protein n=1 Tax=Salibacterium aidingense TaxID=384933 RepID=UPI00041C0A53|nr:glycoside hydrolase family 2 [Salibacterium aidingense]